MMNPKDAIIKHNATIPEDQRIPVKAGKGRMSKAADERCRKLASEGWNIKGYAVTTAPKSVDPAAPVAEKVVTKSAAVTEKVIADFTLIYDEKAYRAVSPSGKVYSMRECCNNCRVSLVQCHCIQPTILGNIAVTIKPI